jgi:hypothetical protein
LLDLWFAPQWSVRLVTGFWFVLSLVAAGLLSALELTASSGPLFAYSWLVLCGVWAYTPIWIGAGEAPLGARIAVGLVLSLLPTPFHTHYMARHVQFDQTFWAFWGLTGLAVFLPSWAWWLSTLRGYRWSRRMYPAVALPEENVAVNDIASMSEATQAEFASLEAPKKRFRQFSLRDLLSGVVFLALVCNFARMLTDVPELFTSFTWWGLGARVLGCVGTLFFVQWYCLSRLVGKHDSAALQQFQRDTRWLWWSAVVAVAALGAAWIYEYHVFFFMPAAWWLAHVLLLGLSLSGVLWTYLRCGYRIVKIVR